MCTALAGNYSVYTAVRESFANGSYAWRGGRVGDFQFDPRFRLPVLLSTARCPFSVARCIPPPHTHRCAANPARRVRVAIRRAHSAACRE